MEETTPKIRSLFGEKVSINKTTLGFNNEIYLLMSDNNFKEAIKILNNKNYSLISLFCAENFEKHKGFTLFYVFENNEHKEIPVLERELDKNESFSIAKMFPSASWFEREIKDGFGIHFKDAYDKRRLFLHELYPEGFHPLRKSVENGYLKNKIQQIEKEYEFKEVKGEGVYQIPVGPVHAGIIEPGHFRFSVIGETIFNLEIRMFYKHRGIEKLAEGRKPKDAVVIAETISGDETVANAVGFCSAVEKISDITIPKRALNLRTIILEMERIYSHLGDISGMIIDVAYPSGASEFFILREEIFRKNDELTGSRFCKDIISIGGLKKDIPQRALLNLLSYLHDFLRRFKTNIKLILSSPSVYDRFDTTGIISKDLIRPLNITGPAARASGKEADTRINHPYNNYDRLAIHSTSRTFGDVLSRFKVKAHEIQNSVEIISQMIKEVTKGDINMKKDIQDGYAVSLIEAPRGQNFHFVYIKDGKIDRYKIRTSSFCNWQAIEHAVIGNIVPDFPLVNKSLNLSYAGTDL
jgi:formate hydrogenlyase subunit 5